MVEQLAAVSVITRQARDLEPKNNADATGRDFCGHACKAGPASDAESRMSKIFVDSMTFSRPVAGLHGGGNSCILALLFRRSKGPIIG